jgi:hypothetical protein
MLLFLTGVSLMNLLQDLPSMIATDHEVATRQMKILHLFVKQVQYDVAL